MNQNKRIPASIEILKNEKTGKWVIRAKDEFHNLTFEENLPERFEELDQEKRKYWANRSIERLAKIMSKAVSSKLNLRMVKKHGTEQGAKSDSVDPTNTEPVGNNQ